MSRAFYLQNALALIAIAAGGRFLMPGDRREGFGSSSIHNEKLKTTVLAVKDTQYWENVEDYAVDLS